MIHQFWLAIMGEICKQLNEQILFILILLLIIHIQSQAKDMLSTLPYPQLNHYKMMSKSLKYTKFLMTNFIGTAGSGSSLPVRPSE
ncbi:hypothetical protein BJP43_04165 [Candidatus Williamhamiltonella defendens]|uniref:Uncharacterized protein n=1 Tax=Candidatus Williamhamiltonella defendens TaxID=138072 RepID=A0A2D3TCR8_9ENTR|nr:hypothetical protein BJP43_04165 [Candidatus Hamiltonella defensa]AYB48352.1 hypothetical protein CJJ19_01165 [Candidatus Hamiltonella defensa]